MAEYRSEKQSSTVYGQLVELYFYVYLAKMPKKYRCISTFAIKKIQ